MRNSPARLAALALTAATFTVPAFAQTMPPSPPPASPSPAPPPAVSPPAANADRTKMEHSTAMTPGAETMDTHRASQIIGMAVVNEKDQTIGKVDDILIGGDNKVNTAVISVGGFLGIDAKLVAVPFDRLMPAANDPKSLTMPNATKEQLQSMPEFKFGKGA